MLSKSVLAVALCAAGAEAFAPTGFSPALRSGFQGASLNTQAAVTSKAFGPTMKAEAWVRVCTSDSIVGNNQQDALIAGAPVLAGRYSNGKVWAISAKNSATGTEMFGGKVDEAAQTLQDPQWGTQYSLVDGSVVGKWCPSPPILGGLIGAVFPARGVWVPQVREQGGYVEVLIDVDAKADFEKSYWKGILDAQGKTDGGYY
jgi:nitrite reductase/ring-hydroxylating ferredoxin subunit